MNTQEVVGNLETYESALDDILGRFTRDRDGIHIAEGDHNTFETMVLQLRDLFDDEFLNGSSHSQPLLAYYNESVAKFSGSPSYRGVEGVRNVVVAALARVRQNPAALKQIAFSTSRASTRNPEFLLTLAERFHLVAKQIRNRREDRPTLAIEDEFDVQDLWHALLTIFFDDVRKEEWAPTYAGGASRMDFLLPEIESVVEVKKSRPTLSARQLGEELIVDIAKYAKHPMCRRLYCLVYDPEGRIANPRGVENDLNNEKREIAVHVMIVPRGL